MAGLRTSFHFTPHLSQRKTPKEGESSGQRQNPWLYWEKVLSDDSEAGWDRRALCEGSEKVQSVSRRPIGMGPGLLWTLSMCLSLGSLLATEGHGATRVS